MTTLTSPITGGAQTGFTAPTYTLTSDIAPDVNGKQWAVTGLGGTQTGVLAHSAGSPFTVTIQRPKVLKLLPSGSVSNSIIRSIPRNAWKVIVRKGVTPASGQPASVALFTGEYSLPAGADTFDPTNIRALNSAIVGALSQISAAWGDSQVTGIL